MYSMSYQMYKCEHGLTTAAEQRAADVRAGEVAAALSDALRNLRSGLGRAFHPGRRVRSAPGTAGAAAAPARALSGIR